MHSFRTGEVHLSVQECASREFPRLRLPTAGIKNGAQNLLRHQYSPWQLISTESSPVYECGPGKRLPAPHRSLRLRRRDQAVVDGVRRNLLE